MDVYVNLCNGTLPLEELPKVSPKTVNFFICSAFTDFYHERKLLEEKAFPYLREYCQKTYGLQFRAIDLKLGIENEAWEEFDYYSTFCKIRDIYARVDVDCCPVILLGQKFGLPLLPKRLPYKTFELFRSTLRAHPSKITKQYAVLDECYRRDENATEGPEQVLLPVSTLMPGIYSQDVEERNQAIVKWDSKRKILSQLLKSAVALCLEEGTIDDELAYNLLTFELDSAVARILMDYNERSAFGPIIIARDVIDLNNYLSYAKTSDFTDLAYGDGKSLYAVDPFLGKYLDDLRRRMEMYIPNAATAFETKYRVLWRFDDGIDPEYHEKYLDGLHSDFVRLARQAIDARAELKMVFHDANLIRVFDHVYTNMSHCRTLSPFAMGREDIVGEIIDYCLNPDVNYPIMLTGSVDAGKSLVMAHTFENLQNELRNNSTTSVIALRILQDNSKLPALSQSLFDQIHSVLCPSIEEVERFFERKLRCDTIFQLMESLAHYKNKCYIFLAGLENITHEDPEVDINSIIPHELPSNVRLIFTNTNIDPQTHHKEIVLNSQTIKDFGHIISDILEQRGRMLTCEQHTEVNKVLPCMTNMFHASIILEKLTQVTSTEEIHHELLPKSNKECYVTKFKELEKKYGKELIQMIVQLINASEKGLTDGEMEDILSLSDSVVLEKITSKFSHLTTSFRFPTVMWLMIKNDMRILLGEYAQDGIFVNYWVNNTIAKIVDEEYPHENDKGVLFHYIIADYYLGVWHGIPKFVEQKPNLTAEGVDNRNGLNTTKFDPDDENVALDRLLPSQKVMYKHDDNVFFNVRQYRQLPRHLFLSNRVEELERLVLFSYEWIYYKIKALGIEALLKDFELIEQHDAIILVEETLRISSSVISKDLNNLAAELIGHLLPYCSRFPRIQELVKQCDRLGPTHCPFLPSFSYPKLPGSTLQRTVVCERSVQNLLLNRENQKLYVRQVNDAKLYQYDLISGQINDDVILSDGVLSLLQGGKMAALLENRYKKSVKIHSILDGSLVNQVIVSNWLDPQPLEEKGALCITQMDVSENLLALIVSGMSSRLLLAEVTTPKPKHVLHLGQKASVCKFTNSGKYVFVNSADTLLGFSVENAQQSAEVELKGKPIKILFSTDDSRMFVLCDTEKSVVVAHVQEGALDMSYKVMFEKSLNQDYLIDIRLSADDEQLLLRGKETIIVYSLREDAISCHILRPPEIPTNFKLPNSDYVELNYTEAEFAFDNKVVVAAIFRDVILYDVGAHGQPIAILHAPVGIITRMLIDHENDLLFGYVDYTKEIHMWNMKSTFLDNIVIDALTNTVAVVSSSARFPKAIAMCENSDEVGIIDTDTGYLTDLYTHEGQVRQCAISSCGNFALVGISPKRPNTANIFWSLVDRRILKEFGDIMGHYVPCKQTSDFFYIVQTEAVLDAGYEIYKISCEIDSDEASISGPLFQIRHILSPSFLVDNDNFLVCLSAEEYIDQKNYYVNPLIIIWSTVHCIITEVTSALLGNFTCVKRILSVQNCPDVEANVVVLYATEECNYQRVKCPAEVHLDKNILFLNVRNANVTRIIQNVFPREIDIISLRFSPSASLCIANDTELYSTEVGCFLSTLDSQAGNRLHLCGFVFGNSAVLLSMAKILYCFRLPECSLMGTVDVHYDISCVHICPDNRSILVGTESGNVLAYTLVDSVSDAVDDVVQTISSRRVFERQTTRSWDRVVTGEGSSNARLASGKPQRVSRSQDVITGFAETSNINNGVEKEV